MKLLTLHVNSIEVEATKLALKGGGADEDPEPVSAENALVAFAAVEKNDEGHVDIAAQAAEEIQDIAEQVSADEIVVYPYVHLTSSPSSPAFARDTCSRIAFELRERGLDTKKAPFGWYKSFKIDQKGHPLAELSREITPEEHSKESEALDAEEELESFWYVLTPEGELVDVEEFDFSDYPDLKALYEYETEGTRAANKEPPHVSWMQEQELVDYEPGSDAGNLRWYPKGQLMKRLLEKHINSIVHDHGGMQVETPIMYDYDHPALSKYLQRFPARQYVVNSDDKEFFLRFAACFGQYLIGHDATISWRHLPLRIYELSHYSFRREQSGEVSGLRRLRAFTMPDMHTVTADMEQATEEFLDQFDLCREWMIDIDVPYATAIRFVRDFYEENEEFAKEMVSRLGRPVLVEMWDDRFFYFVTKFEFNVIDTQGKASALSTVQIDVENTERFDISYTDSDGEQRYGPLLHASISGSIDRNLYGILETQAKREEDGAKPEWPFWLAPTQVRFIPVNEEFTSKCYELAQRIDARVDIDDRDESIGKRIRAAELDWVPMTVVYGGREEESGKLPVRLRDGQQKEMTIEELEDEVVDRLSGKPFEPLPLPRKLSERPIFRG